MCIHQADGVAGEILDWSQRVRAQHGRKKDIVPGKPDNPPMTQRVRACLAVRAQTVTSQPNREKVQFSMQRIARIKHRCRQHNREIGTESKKHYVMVEKEHMKCMMCAQTRPFDKTTIFLTQQWPAAQTNWMVRIQQLKSEMGIEQQERAGDIRSLLCKRTRRGPKKRRMKRQDGR